MLCDGGLDPQNETVPVASSIITDASNEMDIQVLQLSRARTKLRARAPKPGDVFGDDDVKKPGTSIREHSLIARSFCCSSGDPGVK
jgi:hypothetical protein